MHVKFCWGVIISVIVESLPLDRLNINDFPSSAIPS